MTSGPLNGFQAKSPLKDGLHAACVCEGGYRLSETVDKNGNYYGKCENIDECLERTHSCQYHTKCVDMAPWFQCQLDDGFQSIGSISDKDIMTIIDIDECEQNPCGENEKCINSDGTYTCLCKQGYFLSGGQCESIIRCGSGLGKLLSSFNRPGKTKPYNL